ncbi:MAG: class I SAM-dependent methyltransferase [Gaiellaceae bacterium]
MRLAERLREWRIDRMTDRIARRPHGRKARATYGADDAHGFLWEPVLEALSLGPGDRLLDVGCGGGAFLNRARQAGCAIAGIDHSRDMAQLARQKTGARIELGDVEAMPFADGEFTAVSCLVAFFFFADPVAALREIRRVLEAGRGRVAVMTTAPEAKGTMAAPYPLATRGHFYTDEELLSLAREAGLTSARLGYRDEWSQLLVAQP